VRYEPLYGSLGVKGLNVERRAVVCVSDYKPMDMRFGPNTFHLYHHYSHATMKSNSGCVLIKMCGIYIGNFNRLNNVGYEPLTSRF